MSSKRYIKLSAILLLLAAAFFLFIPDEEEEPLFITASDEKEDGYVSLDDKFDRVLDKELLDGTVTGISIRSADSGEELYSKNGDIRLHPASNMKLLTAVSALATLGPEYRFATEVWTDGEIRGNVLHGNLYLKGKGDPTLMKKNLDQFAVDLQNKGIQRITGNVIADDSWYDDVRLSQDLNWSDESNYTGAQVSALTLSPNGDYDAGTVIVEVNPTEDIGGQAEVTLTPETDYVTIINETKIVNGKENKDITIEREHGTNNIIIKGKVPVNAASSKSWVAVWEPAGYAVNVFKKSMEDKGISFAGLPEVTNGVTPESSTLLTSRKSIALEELFIPFMKLSNNGHAEVLVKEMGKIFNGEGSWEKGLEVMEQIAADLGMNTDTMMIRDGSGMSHKNMVPANEWTHLLYDIKKAEWFNVFTNSLPVAGEEERLIGGTLRNRMMEEPTKGNVIAKTGSITGVSGLSGYVTSIDGKELIFSILINNYLGDTKEIRKIEDKLVTILAEHEF
ncbi:D-alanyl-D-alanine carboxypeptidase/D-alanyl-D-alanine-endopeptidase [Virgibacillus profundi]|uniref:D-alanyl-D-alanine carboxypeptidase/D-alanyl-D-alanine-endopeptidase n=1 Tax=Virgibacillus profundi TaxID=2024555 RepID=A0A2A2IAX8_9BACI|nr:D-alanyl-D-alanine carboxypeptidase/D-alanyl-D-alanine-endopeptidase [Virgibacillus profundi]PAV28444.1 D-alanyl-D-alanine carboxypeptidase/D-alanyl-D-alanine-endopeptidase [Virgibacillus profundi]PXY52617.1 D-alanyl-D-alanine carboxypeptidase/D-alanyl-D-alanine-endopeptidase [Virgibacillus profundi]